MKRNSESGWYLIDGEAKYWDGKLWLDFVWSNPPGSYDFPNGSGYWNGEIFSSYNYVDSKNKRHQKINSKFTNTVIHPQDLAKANIVENLTYSSINEPRNFHPILRFRYFLTKLFASLGILALVSIFFDPGDWLQGIGTWLLMWILAYVSEPKR